MTIRRTPHDFIVHELLSVDVRQRLLPEPSSVSPFAVYELTKTSLTTPDAVQWLAKSLGVRSTEFSYAGLKDKHAHTVQHVTLRTTGQRPQPLPDHAEGQGWSATRLGWSADELSASDIEGNRFSIVVRDLSREANREMQRRAAALTLSAESPGAQATADAAANRELAFVNYFGDQRFGSARHGQGWIAEHLIRGEFEQALRLSIATPARKDIGKKRAFSRLAATRWGDWTTLATELPRCPERRAIEELAAGKTFRDAFAALPYFSQQICVEAYQSHLWNDVAARFVRASLAGRPPEELIEADDPFGPMLFPAAVSIDPAWLAMDAPLIGQESRLAPPWDQLGGLVLQERGLTQDQLRIPGLRRPAFGGALRPLFARATRFVMPGAEPDDLGRPQRLKRTLAFDLPRGSYATVLLRALGQ